MLEASDNAEVVKQGGDAWRVAQFTAESQTFLVQCARGRVVSLPGGNCACAPEGMCARCLKCIGCSRTGCKPQAIVIVILGLRIFALQTLHLADVSQGAAYPCLIVCAPVAIEGAAQPNFGLRILAPFPQEPAERLLSLGLPGHIIDLLCQSLSPSIDLFGILPFSHQLKHLAQPEQDRYLLALRLQWQ